MLNFLTKGLAKMFGTKSDKDIKQVLPYVDQINQEFEKLASISDDDLRNKTKEVRGIIDQRLKSIDDNIAALHQQIEDEPDLDIDRKEALFNQIDKLEEDRNKELEVVLMDVLPQAFAIVKETAKRLTVNKKLEVTATIEDREYAAKHSNVTIEGDKAIWANKWIAGGTEVTWEMIHYDVQLIGGIVLHQGKIAEMATGEGKTLVATLPAFLNALANRGVHVVTVNSYLAKRDSEWMAPLFQFHGLTIDCIDNYQPNSEERKKAYRADITYGTNNEFGFDYLRDNMAHTPEELVQRKHNYAIVDEVDSVLVDDARTPLIISGPVPMGDQHEFLELKPKVDSLVNQQRQLANGFLTEAKRLIKAGDTKQGGFSLLRAYRALPKNKALIKFLSEEGVKQILQKTENHFMQDNSREMKKVDEGLLFVINEKNNQVELTDNGIKALSEGMNENFFILPDIGTEIARIENMKIPSDEMSQQKEALFQDFAIKSERIHTLTQLLKAYTLFEKDTEYVIVDNKIMIVDEQTGRIMDGRRYSDSLHQAIEAKENVKIEAADR